MTSGLFSAAVSWCLLEGRGGSVPSGTKALLVLGTSAWSAILDVIESVWRMVVENEVGVMEVRG